MSYLEQFVYGIAKHHYEGLNGKTMKPKCMLDIFNEELERGLIQATLEYNGFHIGTSAEAMGMSTNTLRSKLKKYDIFILKV